MNALWQMLAGADPRFTVQALYAGALGLGLLGLYAIVVQTHLLRILLGVLLLESGVNLFLVAVGFRPDAIAPIFDGRGLPMVDPLPQALVLTAIVIGVGVLALGLALAVRVQKAFGTLDTHVLARRLQADEPPAKSAGTSLPQAVETSR